ncbi:hypothetical protein WR25_26375 [Diploscapter pachys]|uniref:Acyltransferase 3 domain-containing protein n=1 Tax=Diploscapter pachys TaxID=2018661 RepID=A0A2A2JI62_9BILA|nr:hypothetical protein WR25_26375 [Diploscapter pachys]
MLEKTALPQNNAPKRRDIQGLRAWAIILVLLYHFFPKYFPNGYIGVDMFFVISGYLIAMICYKFETINLTTLRTFYYRRIKRIFPLYYLAMVMIFISMYLLLPRSYYAINASSGKKAVLLITNLKFHVDAEQDYEKLLANAEDLFTHAWSLCVEIQWYFIAPLLFLIQRRFSVPAMAFFIGIGWKSFTFHLFANQTIAFNCVFARIWQFCAGITAFIITKQRPIEQKYSEPPSKDQSNQDETIRNDKELLPYIAYFLFGLILFTFSWLAEEPSHLRVEITFVTTILIVIGEYHEILILSNPLMAFIGDISYSLYLVHWPVYVIFKSYFKDNIYAFLVGALLSVVISTIIYYVYERPYLKFSPLAILILTIGLIGWSLVLTQPDLIMRKTDYSKKYDIYGADLQHGDPSKNLSIAIAMNHLEGTVNVEKNNAIEHCEHIKFDNPVVKPPMGLCKIPGNHTGKLRLLVIGNSWACNQGGIVYEAFRHIIKEFYAFCLVACEPLIEKQSPNICFQAIKWEKVVSHVQPDLVIMLHRPIIGKGSFNDVTQLQTDDVYQQHLRVTQWYESQGYIKKIYILQAMPICHWQCTKLMNDFMENEKKPLKEFGNQLVVYDDYFERKRFEKLAEDCKICELYDYLPLLRNKDGNLTFYDESTNLVFMDDTNHLNKFGRDKVKIIYNQLAESFTKEFPEFS